MNLAEWFDNRRDAAAERIASMRAAGQPTVARRRTRLDRSTVRDEPPRDRLLWIGVDVAAALALLVLVTLAWLPTYGGGWVWVASMGGGVIGAAVAVLATSRRWDALKTAGAAAAAYLLLGTPLAMPSAGIGYVIPSGRSLVGLLTGPVTAWKGMLTVQPPIGETGALLVPVLLVGIASVLASVTIGLRSGRPVLAWLPMVAAMALAFALGVSTSYAPARVGVAAVVLVLLWVAYRRTQQRSTLLLGSHGPRWSGVVTGALVLALVAGGVTLARPLLEPARERSTIRELVRQPLDIQRYPSPLQSFRRNVTDFKTEVMLTAAGAPSGTRIRVATMDAYDGYTYNVSNSTAPGADSGSFRRIGARVVDDTPGTEIPVSVTVGRYEGVWVPTVGQTLRVEFTGEGGVALADGFYYNQASGTGLEPGGVRAGATYALTALIPTPRTRDQIQQAGSSTVALPPADPLPDVVRDRAAAWSALAPTGGGALAQAFTDQLRKGYYSHGQATEVTSRPGHSIARIETLLHDTGQMVGDEEQYAVALALLCRAAGLSARVAYGYLTTSADGVVRGENVTAWTEVNLSGLGWVTFDPTPPKDRTLKEIKEEPQSAPRPQVINPPPPPDKPEPLDPDNKQDASAAQMQQKPPPIDWRLIGTVALVGGVPLLFVVVPIALVVGLKMRRRRLRMTDADLGRRVAGGWAELLDRARDLGTTPAVGGTRTEQAEQLVGAFPRVTETADPRILARQADMTVFSPDGITPGQAQTYWSTVDQAVGGLNRSVSLGRRLRAMLSVRSFRRPRAPH